MYKQKKILAIIPARGGSKRIKNKNLVKVAGKPLIEYTIEAAKKSKYLDRIMVSTDNKKIADFCKNKKVEVIKRPDELALDKTPTLPVLRHVITYLEKKESYSPDYIILLQPTSPLRISADIDNIIELMIKTRSDSAETFCKITERPEWMRRIVNNTVIPPKKISKITRTQDLPVLYKKNGAVYGVKNSILKKIGLYGKHHKAIIMPIERSVDVDEPLDIKLIEFYLKLNKRKK